MFSSSLGLPFHFKVRFSYICEFFSVRVLRGWPSYVDFGSFVCFSHLLAADATRVIRGAASRGCKWRTSRHSLHTISLFSRFDDFGKFAAITNFSTTSMFFFFFFLMRIEKGTGKFAGNTGRHYRIIGAGSSI